MGGGMDDGDDGLADGGASPVAPAAAGGVPPFVAYNKNGLAINFAPSKDPANPSVTQVEATTNSSPMPIAGLNFQVAVPKYMKLRMTPARNAVPPNGSGTVTQLFKVANSMQGRSPSSSKSRSISRSTASRLRHGHRRPVPADVLSAARGGSPTSGRGPPSARRAGE